MEGPYWYTSGLTTQTRKEEQRQWRAQEPTQEDEATRVGQITLSGILPAFVNRIQGYRNSRQMAVNGMLERLCKEDEVGYVDLWDSFVGKAEMYVIDGLHLSGKGAAVFAEGLSWVVASGLGKVRYLTRWAGWFVKEG